MVHDFLGGSSGDNGEAFGGWNFFCSSVENSIFWGRGEGGGWGVERVLHEQIHSVCFFLRLFSARIVETGM